MKDRILHFLSLEKLTSTRFADLIGVQRSGVSHILAGRNKPSFDFIEKMLLAYPTLSAEWLLLGKGEVYKSTPSPKGTFFEPKLFDSVPAPTAEQPISVEVEVEKSAMPEKMSAIPVLAQENEQEAEQVAIFYRNGTVRVYKTQ